MKRPRLLIFVILGLMVALGGAWSAFNAGSEWAF
ncbi:hypothetical protein ABAC460_00665 [Asticcacaulis sp. AC460]|nr:hypothetical protein ABAC460_00665 [Asticcacaulis sp. AC460]